MSTYNNTTRASSTTSPSYDDIVIAKYANSIGNLNAMNTAPQPNPNSPTNLVMRAESNRRSSPRVVKTSQVPQSTTSSCSTAPSYDATAQLLEQTKLENAKSIAQSMILTLFAYSVLVAITEIKQTLRYNLQQISLKNPPLESITALSKIMNLVKAELISLSTVVFLNDFKVWLLDILF